MNIYITPKNESILRDWHSQTDDVTMSGLINRLLEDFWNEIEFHGVPEKTGVPQKIEEVKTFNRLEPEEVSSLLRPEKNISGATPNVVHVPDVTTLELDCCKNEVQPCKHWVWDINSGEGYVNSLSGRLMEVE